MSATGDPANQPPKVFSQHLEDLLQREYDRMATLIARGEVIARTVLSILTVLIAVATLTLGASVGLDPHLATWIVLALAVGTGLGALWFASLAQSAPSEILGTGEATITEMLSDEKWDRPDGDPLRIVAGRNAAGIKSLRKANGVRASQAKKALKAQFGFIAGVLIAVAVEVVLQLI